MSGIDSNTLVMLHMNELSGFIDSGPAGRTVTAFGNAHVSNDDYKFGSACGKLDGSGDGLYTPDHADFAFGAGNATIDFWVKFNALGTAIFYHQGDSGNGVYFQYYQPNSTLNFQVYANAALVAMVAPVWSPVVDVWYHIAAVKNGTDYALYVNGTKLGNAAGGAVPNIAGAVWIGCKPDGSASLNGFLDEYRVSKTARWTANFTPATEEYAIVPPAPPPALGVSEHNYWKDKAALLDPNAYVYAKGTFNITENEPVYLVNGWQMNFNGNNNFWYHRKGDIDNALLLPAGTPIKHSGSPAGYGFEYGYAYYAKPSLVNSDERYEEARDLYYQRMERLKHLELHSAEVRIAQTHSVNDAIAAGTLTVMLPADFENGLVTHISMMDGCWIVLENPAAGGPPNQTILNMWDEIDDVKNQRISGRVFLPFKRSVFPQLRIGFGSAFLSASGTPNNPITPVTPGNATYPQYGQIKYYKLPSDW